MGFTKKLEMILAFFHKRSNGMLAVYPTQEIWFLRKPYRGRGRGDDKYKQLNSPAHSLQCKF